MSDFPAYPASERYVLVFSDLAIRETAETQFTSPMSHGQARELLDRIGDGDPADNVLGEIELVVELSPDVLLVSHRGAIFGGSMTHEVRLARVRFALS